MSAPFPMRGEVWNVYTPGQPDDPHQPSLALVVSADERNRVEEDVIVVPIFKHGATGPTQIPIRGGTGGLDHDSVIFCEEITTLDVAFLHDGPRGNAVPESLLRRVVRGVRIAIGDIPMPGD